MSQSTNDISRAAVVGVGAMGINHARVVSELSDVELTALVDPRPEIAETISNRFSRPVYPSVDDMLEHHSIDFAIVAVPTENHLSVAGELIERGISVLVEKPLANSVADGEMLIKMAEHAGVRIGVGHVERFNPAIIALKDAIDGGDIGICRQVAIRRIGPRPARVKDVGVFLDLAIHDIDILSYLVESEIANVSAEALSPGGGPHEDMAVALFKFKNDVIGVITENWISPTKVRDVTVTGDNGMIVADCLTQDVYLYEYDYGPTSWPAMQNLRGGAEGRMIRYRLDREEPLKLEVSAFAESVARGSIYPVSGVEGLNAVRTARHLLKISGGSNVPAATAPLGDG
jgi:UDP-N-acetylglucosamine 3-dehydrogenase